jgi:hypothetical protein
MVCLITAAGVGHAALIQVPADQPSIQQAIDVALPGDVIRVGPGTYQESVRLIDKVGITIEAADAAAMPVILGTHHKSADGFRADDSSAIALRNLRIIGAYDGVRLNRVDGAVIAGLVIEDQALGIRVNRGANTLVIGNTIMATRVEQGIVANDSPGIIVVGNVVDQPDEEGIRIVGSPGAVVHDNHVSNSRGGTGITVFRSPGASIIGSSAVASYRDGFRVANSAGLVLRGNHARDNRNVGFRIEKSQPFATVGDVTGEGNVAIGNGGEGVVVEKARCNQTSCATTTSVPIVTTTVQVTTSSTRTTSTTPTTTSTTTTLHAPPLAAARWRFSVRIATAAGATNVLVPRRSGEPPLEVGIREGHLPSFRVGDRVNTDELGALGGDTLSRLTAAADRHLQANPDDYPAFKGLIVLRWAERVP